MKNRFCLFFTSLIFLISISFSNLSAQGGGNVTANTGSWPPDYEIVWKCLDSADVGSNKISFYEVHTFRAGTTTSIQTFRASGASFTPPAGKQTLGDCAGSATVTIDTLREIQLLILCDDAGPFIRIIQAGYKPGDANITNPKVLGNYTLAMAAYTPSGAIMSEPCAIVGSNSPSRFDVSGNLTLPANLTSYEIHNPGLIRRTLTINGNVSELWPGESCACRSYFDPISQQNFKCPAATLTVPTDGVNNPLRVFYRP